jgi:cysteine-S-conjugate beta-lyase
MSIENIQLLNVVRTPATADAITAEFDRLSLTELRARPGAKWQVPDPRLLPAWVADMDFPVAETVRESLHGFVAGGDYGYPDWPDGASPLRAAFAERMGERFGWWPDAAHVREFTDVTQAVQAVLHLATEKGDGVALHTPAFGPFVRSIENMGRTLVPIPMVDTPTGWTFDLDRFAEDLDNTSCRVLLLVNPQNPTGRAFSHAELRRLADLAEHHGLLVISDEIHSDLTFRPHRHIPFASLDPATAERTVTLTSASKAFNLAGLRCAVGHIGPAWLRREFAALPPNLLGSVGLLAARATLAAWRTGAAWLDSVVDYLDRNRALVASTLAERAPLIRHHLPEATYLAWLDCRALGWGADPAAAFRDLAGVELSPGPSFNPGGDGFVRLNFATSTPVLRHILDRLTTAAALLPSAA